MTSELDNWSVEKWLKKLGLRKYKQSFIDNGYETAELCANLNKDDLDAIGVTNKHHRSTLFTQSRKLLEVVSQESLLTASEELDGGTESPPAPVEAEKMPPSQNPMATIPVPSQSDYSEPWNSGSNASTSNSGLSTLKGAGDLFSERPSVPSPVHRKTSGSGPSRKPPVSPGAELPTYKRKGSTEMTKLQLKLKIRAELFNQGVVLSEPPYCKEVSIGGKGKHAVL